ncbi:MAG: hypothetical protein HKO63_01750 [Acidimicrobiia bacterium]|nr:hypothetical protein [Acidimicrobiia bacterium]MBT8192811.1 hypothetical protein [Acidimicrobiia bacterium]MBT8246810.1 hypothetical protein [Acidimicrobiia bacterium]NNF88838.1 hypothetical protein [Acidimicrobiia bacterium]NNJ46809.1 hypothetical protein [Acidimicrobiia bacterium]
MTDYSSQEANLDEFVDFFNARDLEAVRELLDAEVSAPFFGGNEAETVMQGIGELILAYPGIVVTRGELGDEPVVVAWIPGQQRVYRRMGYFRFTFIDDGENGDDPGAVDGELKIEHIDYSDEIDDGSLLVEEPDPADMAEWESWQEWDEGADD